MTPNQEEAVAAFKRTGSVAKAAREMGLGERNFKRLLDRAGMTPDARTDYRLDPAIKNGMEAVGTRMVPALAWAKVPPKDGEIGYSLMLRPEAEQPEAVAERIREALEGMDAAEPVVAPETVMADLCAVYPLMDAHVGMMAWGRETGSQDYDLDHAAKDMRHAFAKILALTPAAEQSILLIGGDYFHSDDTLAETPANRHKLDVDGRFWKVLDVGIAIIAETILHLLQKHARVHVRVLRGNHGDKGKPQQMALYLSDVCPFWSDTRHRHYLTGHIHHDQAKDIGPLRHESLRAFCPPDAYAASMGYGGRRALQSMTFHKVDGLVLRALDPIDRID